MSGLTDNRQALLMAIAFLIPIGTWCALGFPTDRTSLGILASAIISGIVAGIKELLGGQAPPTNTSNPVTT
jgi:hypothetical protein